MEASGVALVLAAFLQAAEGAPSESPPIAEPEITSPRINAGSRAAIRGCYAKRARRLSHEGRTAVVVTIEADGSVSDMQFVPGIEPWQEETARCVIGHMTFTPGTRAGVPVASTASVPVQFKLENDSGKSSDLTSPRLVSTHAEIEDAYRACYPQNSLSVTEPKYRVSFNERGKAIEIKVVESSGDEAMDSAGTCMIERLKFEPATSDSEPVRSTVILPIQLRPPK
jgi:outer membrane biosynthesis protein TonB